MHVSSRLAKGFRPPCVAGGKCVPAATLGARPGVVRLVRFWFQFKRLRSKFLSHPKVLERSSREEQILNNTQKMLSVLQ